MKYNDNEIFFFISRSEGRKSIRRQERFFIHGKEKEKLTHTFWRDKGEETAASFVYVALSFRDSERVEEVWHIWDRLSVE